MSARRDYQTDDPPHCNLDPSSGRVRAVAALKRWLRRLLVALVVLGLAALVAAWLVVRHYERDLPSMAELRNYDPPQVTRVIARDGSLLAELFIERRTLVPIDRVPRVMKLAVLAAEDADFYHHEGLDYLGMLRALWIDLRTGRPTQGGSTITQQVVKNVLLTPERTFRRKIREMLLARRIEQQLTKDEILELYLNQIYFGHGRWGIEEASRYYFGKGVAKLSMAEAATLAGLPKAPNLYSPRVDFQRSLHRRNAVLEQMRSKGFASAEQVEQASKAPLVLAPAPEALAELAPEAVTEVERSLGHIVGPAARRGGYTVRTTIDPAVQAAARRAVRHNLDAYAKRRGLLPPFGEKARLVAQPFQGTPSLGRHRVYGAVVIGADDNRGLLRVRVGTADGVVRLKRNRRYDPTALPPSRFAEPGAVLPVSAVVERDVGADGIPHAFRLELGPESAMVVIDVASREIRALVGGYAAIRGTLDRASHALRQPGSAFKPVLYGYGIHTHRLTPATPIDLQAEGEPEREQPPMLLREAVARSVNEAARWALDQVGAEGVISFARALGIRSKLAPTPSLALGAYEVRPRELAAVYATLAAQGVYETPVLISEIRGPDGQVVELPVRDAPRRVMDRAEAYVLTSVLTSVVKSGTGWRARGLHLPLAGKTGTTNDAKDAWFGGYTPELACVVWTGFDDARPLGKRESGARTALPAFIDLMKHLYRRRRPPGFKRPAGVVEVTIDPATGLLAREEQQDGRTEVFVAGTEPSELAPEPDGGSEAGAGGAGGASSAGSGGGAPPASTGPGGSASGSGGQGGAPGSAGSGGGSAHPSPPPPGEGGAPPPF